MLFLNKKVNWKYGHILAFLGTIAAIVASIITVIDYLEKPKLKLKVDVYYSDVIWPQLLEGYFNNFSDLKNENVLKEYLFGPASDITENETYIIKRISKFPKEEHMNIVPFRLFWVQT